MLTTIGILLIANAVFNLIVWPSFYRRVAKDPRARNPLGTPTAFLVVHAVLVVVALLLAAASAVFGVIALIGG